VIRPSARGGEPVSLSVREPDLLGAEGPGEACLRLECLDLGARAVQRLHEHGPQLFPERVLADECLDLSDEFGVAEGAVPLTQS
jgi:hypothetical protein